MPVQDHPVFDRLKVGDSLAVLTHFTHPIAWKRIAPAATKVTRPEVRLFAIDHDPVHVVVMSMKARFDIWVGGDQFE